MTNRIFELVNGLEYCTHIKVLCDADMPEKVVGDLGVMIEVEGEATFQTQYTSAVVLKSEIVDYEEPV